MKKVLLLVVLVGLAQSMWAQPKRPLPREFRKLELGMSMEQVARWRPGLQAADLKNDGFRYRWTEELDAESPISKVIYCFDDAEEKPLYELVIFYRDLAQRERWIGKNFGPPNSETGTEWEFILRSGLKVRAWRYEERLVVVGLIPGTEWTE